MLNKIKHISLILFGICFFFGVNAQTDTVYVYEDVVVYDTVVVCDTVFIQPDISNMLPLKQKSINLLQLDTIKHQANLVLISDQQTATFPINRIILDENFNKNIENLESMKELGFFGVVFFAFQTMVLAQTNCEISVGSGIWWESGEMKYVDKPYSSLLSIGVFARRNFANKQFGLKSGIEYDYHFGSDDYKFDGTLGVWHTEDGSEFESVNSNYGVGLHYISVPLLVYYDKYRLQPFLGLNYNYIHTGMQTSSTETKYFSDSHNVGVNLGIGFRINKSIVINLEFKHNLTSDYEEIGHVSGNNNGNVLLGSSYKLRNNQAKMSLIYSFQ